MKTIHLKISDPVYDKFLLLLGKFSKDEVQIIDEKDSYTITKEYLENELSEIENGKASFVSEEVLENKLDDAISNKNQKDWWTEMSEEEKKDINIGLEQADNGILISNEKVMQRFKKWH